MYVVSINAKSFPDIVENFETWVKFKFKEALLSWLQSYFPGTIQPKQELIAAG